MGLSCLTDPTATLVCDASTIINLNATGCAVAVLKALPNPFAISEVTLGELQEDTRSNRNDAKLVAELQRLGLIKALALDDESALHFELLVAGRTSDTLDDGEAATIACAVGIKAVPIIDERKANRICKARYPNLNVGCTVDILAHEALIAVLGADNLSSAVINALQQARMRVLPQYLPWVVDLIGPANASLCPSLPAHVRNRITEAEGI
jgi:predicted nucleic acid-binding protein